MAPALLLGLMIAPAVPLMALRINATLVFLSVCLGNVLMQFVSDDARDILNSFSPNKNLITESNVKIALLLLPAVLTTLFMIKTIRGSSKLVLNILPALGVGLLLTLFIVPLLSPELSHSITSQSLWHQVEKLQDMIVGASALVCLFVLWLQRPKAGGLEEHIGKHHK